MLSLSVFLSTILLSNGLSSSSSSPRSLNRHYLNPSSSSSSSSPSGDDEHDLSPWASATWLLTLDFAAKQASLTDTAGTKNTNDDTPPFSSYGVSGSHLVVTFPVVVDSDDDPIMTTLQEEDPFIGRGASVLRPYSIKKDGNTTNTDTADEEEVVGSMIQNENNFQYITINGTQRIEVSNGGWVLKFPPSPSRGKSTKLKFYFDLLTDLERNDIYLPANTRLYGTADTWRDQTYEDGKQRLRPIRAAYEDAQQQLEEQVSHDTGDRRLDGTGTPLDTFAAYTEMTALVVRRDQTRTAYRTAIQTNQGGGGPGGSGHGYPAAEDYPEGPWPGSTEWLTISDSNPLYARIPVPNKKRTDTNNRWNRLQQVLSSTTPQEPGGRRKHHDYHVEYVGTWTMEAINSLLFDEDE